MNSFLEYLSCVLKIAYHFVLKFADDGIGSDVGWDYQLCAVITESGWGKKQKGKKEKTTPLLRPEIANFSR